jgi:hypothetical protein
MDNTTDASVFAVGTGRCGTHLLESLFKASKGVDSNHIQNSDIDSFYRYAKWYELPVDFQPFLNQRRLWIETAAKQKRLYFESNPYLSFHLNDLYKELNSKFIFIYRNPDAVIRSHMIKGWYESSSLWNYVEIPGIDYNAQINHSFGRIMPKKNAEREMWVNLTRAGKIAWMWSVVNGSILEQLESIPSENRFMLKVEELSFSKFQELETFLGYSLGISESVFSKILHDRPGKGKGKFDRSWTADESDQINTITSDVAKQLGYFK